MSEKKAKQQRKKETAFRPSHRSVEVEQDLPAPKNFTNPYTLTLADSLFTWYAWQIRPKPLLRRLLLVFIIAVVWISILTTDKPLEEKWTAYLFSLVTIPGYLLVTAIISTLMGFITYPIKKGQFTDAVLYWDDERIEWITPAYVPKHVWSQIKAHFVTTRVVILALQGTLIAVPTRAFKNESDLENFISVVKKKAVGLRPGFSKKDKTLG